MKYDFNEVHNRLGTYCTQWDYIQDRFNKKDLIHFQYLIQILLFLNQLLKKSLKLQNIKFMVIQDGIIMILNLLLQDILKEDIIHILKKIGFYIVQQSCIQFLY